MLRGRAQLRFLEPSRNGVQFEDRRNKNRNRNSVELLTRNFIANIVLLVGKWRLVFMTCNEWLGLHFGIMTAKAHVFLFVISNQTCSFNLLEQC